MSCFLDPVLHIQEEDSSTCRAVAAIYGYSSAKLLPKY